MFVVVAFRIFAGLVSVFWMAIAGFCGCWYYDRLTTTPAITLDLVLFHPKIAVPAPFAPLGARLAADERDLKTCSANVATARGALDRQNAAIASLKISADALQARGRAAVAAADAAGQGRLALARRILAEHAAPGADELALCRQADQVLKETKP